MLLEKRVAGDYIVAKRLLDYYEKNGIVSLDVQEIANSRAILCHGTWNLLEIGGFGVWLTFIY